MVKSWLVCITANISVVLLCKMFSSGTEAQFLVVLKSIFAEVIAQKSPSPTAELLAGKLNLLFQTIK